MRYRELLIVLSLVATTAALVAEPARELPPSGPPIGRPIPKGKAATMAPELTLAVLPQSDFARTEFIVSLRSTEGAEIAGSRAPIGVGVRLGESPVIHWLKGSPEKVGDLRWRFSGADVVLPEGVEPDLSEGCSTVMTFMDPEASPFARSIPTRTFESRPIRVVFHEAE